MVSGSVSQDITEGAGGFGSGNTSIGPDGPDGDAATRDGCAGAVWLNAVAGRKPAAMINQRPKARTKGRCIRANRLHFNRRRLSA